MRMVSALLVLAAAAAALAACDDPDRDRAESTIASVIETATAVPTATTQPSATNTPSPTATRAIVRTPIAEGFFEVACGDILAPVDKQHRLPAGCEPDDLVDIPSEMSTGGQRMRREAAAAFGELFAAAQQDGFTILAASSYRSYETQVAVHAGHVARNGQAEADRVSARPGHSEHQLGTTTDVTTASAGFSLGGFRGTPAAAWLAENAWRFGFVVSYPEGKEHITGYVDEPWHIRWIGLDEAARVRTSGLTLHEWLLR